MLEWAKLIYCTVMFPCDETQPLFKRRSLFNKHGVALQSNVVTKIQVATNDEKNPENESFQTT